MMLTPLALPNLNPLASAAALAAVPPSPAAYEGVPIYLLPSGTTPSTPTYNFFPKIPDVKMNLAAVTGSLPKVDTSKHYHIFVGDLSPEIENKSLKDAFSPFGEVSDAKVIRDLQTLKSKGYGFVSFVNKEDAERAIEQMNGQWLGRRTIRTNWATRKPQSETQKKQLQFEDVYTQTGPLNCTVYVGNTNATTTEQHLRDAFTSYGTIQEIRIFKQQGYCFVRYDTKEAACQAICNVNGNEINGVQVKCSWGREDGGKIIPEIPTPTLLSSLGYAYPTAYNWANCYYNPVVYQQWQGLLQNWQNQQTAVHPVQAPTPTYFTAQ